MYIDSLLVHILVYGIVRAYNEQEIMSTVKLLMDKLNKLLFFAIVLFVAMHSSEVKAYDISPRDSAVAGFIAYFWCIQRTQGNEAATQQWEQWNTVINVQQNESESIKIAEIAKAIYDNTGLSSYQVCPNASEVTLQEKERIQAIIYKLRLK